MTLVETILVFAVAPLAVYGVVALLTLRDKAGRGARYRPGQEWTYPPLWWSANPAGLDHGHDAPAAGTVAPRRSAKGGARGSW